MNKIKCTIYRMLGTVLPGNRGIHYLLEYYKMEGMQIGADVHFFSRVKIGEPYLVSIGKHSTVAGNVCFLTHDASVGALGDRACRSDLCGRISIGENCFVGYGSILLSGISIPNNSIIAAGSVVTKSIPTQGCIIGGNPAKVIGSVEEYMTKYGKNFMALHGLNSETRKEYILRQTDKLLKK